MSAIFELSAMTLRKTSKQPALRRPCWGWRDSLDWELVEDVELSDGRPTLVLAKYPQLEKSGATDDAILKQIKKLGQPAGQLYAQKLLKWRQRLTVPRDWLEGLLFFPGTVWRNPRDGSLLVPYIFPDEHYVWNLWKIWDILLIPKLRLGWGPLSLGLNTKSACVVYIPKITLP